MLLQFQLRTNVTPVEMPDLTLDQLTEFKALVDKDKHATGVDKAEAVVSTIIILFGFFVLQINNNPDWPPISSNQVNLFLFLLEKCLCFFK